MNGNTFLIADDHPLFRLALRTTLQQITDHATIYEAERLDDVEALLQEHNDIDLVFLDLLLTDTEGLSALITLRGLHPQLPILVVSANEEPQTIAQCEQFGANGYVAKSDDASKLRIAIDRVLKGESYWPVIEPAQLPEAENDVVAQLASLTPQQFRVLKMVSEGMLNKQIAFELDITEATIKAHVGAIFKKFNVRTRTQLVLAVNELDLGAATHSASGQQS